MNVLIPVSRYRVKYQVASGRPFSFFERLALEGVDQGLCSIEQLTDTFRVHQRVVIEVVVSLMQAGWVAINRDSHDLITTKAGKEALRRDEALPSNIIVQDRIDYVVGERVEGKVASSAEVTFVSKQSLKKSIGRVAKLQPSDIPHPLDPGIVSSHLNVREGEWLRTIASVTILRNSSDYVVVNVDQKKKVTGLPPAWKQMLEGVVIDAAVRKEDDLIKQNIAEREDEHLSAYVRDYDWEAQTTNSLDDSQLSWMKLETNQDHLIVGGRQHRTLLMEFMEHSDFLFIATPTWTPQGVEYWSEVLIEAQNRGTLLCIVLGGPTVGGRSEPEMAIKVLRALSTKPEEEDEPDWQSLIAGNGPSYHQSTIIIADMGNSVEAVVGSGGWLDRDTSDGNNQVLSMHFTEPEVVARLARLAADLSTADGPLVQEFIPQYLQSLAGLLDQRVISRKAEELSYPAEFDELNDEPYRMRDQDLKQGDFVARILIGEHRAILSNYAKRAKQRLIVAGGLWDSKAKYMVGALQNAAKNLCPRVELHYHQTDADQPMGEDTKHQQGPTEQERKSLESLGVKLYDQRLLPSFAVQDSSRAMIVGFNWLSPCSTQKSSSLTTDICIEIRGEELVSRLLNSMGIPEERKVTAKLPCPYVKSFSVKGLRSVNEAVWTLGETDDAPGWHVLIGDNGSGKSTLLRALALALMGQQHSNQLKAEWLNWPRDGETEAQTDVTLIHGDLTSPVCLKWQLEDEDELRLEHECDEGVCADVISMGYGPLRQFGGNGQYESRYGSQKAIARHISLYDYQVVLNKGLSWLIRLQHHSLKGDSERSMLLAQIRRLINECDLFPTGVRLAEISPDELIFSDDQEKKFIFMDLSEGYQAVLGLTIDIIRNLSEKFGPGQLFDSENPDIVIAPGIVLIDEVDAHLHPTWQQSIGPWLIRHFPNIQFIVTTHSPLICQATDQGTVFHLPGTAIWEQERETAQAELLKGKEKDRLIYGNMVEAYGSKAFGQIQRSVKGTEKLNRLATLNLRELEQELSEKEKQEQISLRSIFPTSAYIQTQE